MPLYEYECEKGHRFEKIQKFSDPLVEACPTCGSPVHKLMSSPAIQFKGSGWYITDYARKDSVPAKTEGGDSAGKEKSADTKTDAKPDSKTETKSESKSETKADAKPATPKT
jgi:putative FmdB family regulatory protein